MTFGRVRLFIDALGVGAYIAHIDKLGSLTCSVYSTDTREYFSWKEPVHNYLLL